MEEAWLFLIAACILEPIWVVCLERSDNFKRPAWAAATVVAVLSCLYLLSRAVISIGPGVAYSILAGIGAVGAAIAGIVLCKEKMNVKKVAYISLIVVGVIGVRLTSRGIRCP